MLQKFFTAFYNALIGLFDTAKPRLVGFDVYRKNIFTPVGIWTMLSALGFVLIFYYVFNGTRLAFLPKTWNKPKHWWLMLLLVAGVGTWLAYYISLKLGAAPEPYLRHFIIVNMLVAAGWFFLFSLVPNLIIRHGAARNRPFAV